MKAITSILAGALLLACGQAATKDDPCPQGICTGPAPTATGTSPGTDGGAPGADAGCQEAWACTAWVANGQGQYTRTCTDSAKCGTSANKPSEGPVALPDLDMGFYNCNVEPIFDRGCAMLGCHGTETTRVFKVYARARLRHSEVVPALASCVQSGPQNLAEMGTGTTMCDGWLPHTQTEWQQNYDNARSFYVGMTDPEQSELLTQPKIGGKNHTGVHLFKAADADYQTIKQWLGGAKLAGTCDPDPN